MHLLREFLNKRFSEKKYPDLNDPSVRKAMEAGIELFEKKYKGKMYPWILAGRTFRPVNKDSVHRSYNPSDREQIIAVVPRFEKKDIPDLEHLLSSVRKAGRQFADTVHWRKRIGLLFEISKVVEERFWLFCAVMKFETGQSDAETIGETDEAVDFPLATALYLEEIYREILLESPPWSGDFNGKSYIAHGTYLNAEPFNFPVAIAMDMACKPLAMGNSIIMKPSDKAPLCGYLVYESICIAFERLGIPHKGVVNYCPGGPEVVHMMLPSPDIAGFSFTGSSAALDEIKSKHGNILRNKYHGKSLVSFGSGETSGVNIAIVWHDTDIARAAGECAKSFWPRQGQKCSSGRIIMVHEQVRDAFVEKLKEAIEKVRYGKVTEGADVGPVITREAKERIIRTIKNLRTFGIITDTYDKKTNVAANINPEDLLVPKILFAQRDINMGEADARMLMNTEIFGPVTTVVSVPDLTTVKRLCELSEFGLTGTSFTSNIDLQIALSKIIPAGNLYYNRKCTGALVESECFGGISSRSSPMGIKGKDALPLFGSRETHSGFYDPSWSAAERREFINKMVSERGVVFSKT